VLHDISWELKRGENWAIFGPNGAGKSTLLRLLHGEIWPAPANGGSRLYNFDGQPTTSPIGVKQRMKIVSAEHQQRYTRVHSRKYGDASGRQITARDIVFTGLLDSELVTRKPRPDELEKVSQVMRQIGIEDLADAQFDKLSQGQLRKALIARAVVGEPDLLILDEVGVGLDAASRHQILDLIQRIAAPLPFRGGARGGVGAQVLMTTHRRDELIPAIAHVLELKHGRIHRQIDRETYFANLAHRPHARPVFAPMSLNGQREHRPFLIRIVNASVALDEGSKVVLRDVNWRMNEGEHWMIVGDNGVGKTTLLKLILGELWPAQGGVIERFGKRNFTNVWEIKKRIGYVSTEFQTRYFVDLTAEQVISTGFWASVGWLQPTTNNQRKRVREMIELFNLQSLTRRSILEMSYGQARKVLIARALVNHPRIVILDEIFDGLDAYFRAELAEILEQVSKHTSVILVTHHEADVLPCITHRMVMKNGRVVSQEQREEK
jgi:molybdate transport system ATP-binding protein